MYKENAKSKSISPTFLVNKCLLLTHAPTHNYIYTHKPFHLITQQLFLTKPTFWERTLKRSNKTEVKLKIDGEEDYDLVVHHLLGGDVFDYWGCWLQSPANRANDRLWSNYRHRREWWFWLFLGGGERFERPSFDEELGFPVSVWTEQERTWTLMSHDHRPLMLIFFYFYFCLCINYI